MSGIIGVSPDMRSGVVGKYPVGHVLKMESRTTTSENTTTAAHPSIEASDIYVAITPTLATNKIIIHFEICMWTNFNSGSGNFQCYRSVDGAAQEHFLQLGSYADFSNSKGTDDHAHVSYTIYDTSYDSATEIIYMIYYGLTVGQASGSRRIRLSYNGQRSTVTAWEVQL